MRALRKYFDLPPEDRTLLWKALGTVAICRAALWFAPFERVRRWAAAAPPVSGGVPVERLAWSVKAAARRMPGATCLVQALALQRLLSQSGKTSTLEVGVAKDSGRFTAHAWLTCEGRVLIGGGKEGYAPIAAWKSGRS